MTLRQPAFLLFAALLFQPAFASDWPMCRRESAQSGATDDKVTLPLRLAWQFNAGRFAGNTSAPAVVQGVVYFASGDRVYAVDADTGTLKWKYPGEQPLSNTTKSSVAVSGGIVYFGCNDGNLYAVSAADGKYLWSFATGAAVRSSPIIVGDTVFVGSDDDYLYAVNATTGVNIWKGSGFKTRSDIPGAPAAGTGIVTFASMDLYVYGATQPTGDTRWAYRLSSTSSKSSPVVQENTVYICASSTVYGLMLRSGLQKLGIPLPAEAVGSPAVSGRDLYVVCKDKKLHAFTVTGRIAKPKWEQPADLTLTPTCSPTITGEAIFVAGERGAIAAFSAENGSLKWRYVITPSAMGGFAGDFTTASSPPVVADGKLFLLTDDGALHCFTSDAPDNLAPETIILDPQPSTVMSGSPPIPFSVVVYDQGCGVDPSSIQLMLDDQNTGRVEHTFDMPNSVLNYETPVTQPLKPLNDGLHTVYVTVSDWLGNVSQQSWSFIVDNSLPPRAAPKSKLRPTLPAPPAAPVNQPTEGRSRPRMNRRQQGSAGGSGANQVQPNEGPGPSVPPPPPPVVSGPGGP